VSVSDKVAAKYAIAVTSDTTNTSGHLVSYVLYSRKTANATALYEDKCYVALLRGGIYRHFCTTSLGLLPPL